ncbi:hypothetical protein SAMN05421636_1231 [Pricia antarctica]|uniref:Uncharacterized protein n=1 Tax=Pricia antarctica TaxID=641691 RepID=A0A1G7JE61_9FLAO|nr:hypothetical protein SAMN05421636_1231 [Pricia antarctica]
MTEMPTKSTWKNYISLKFGFSPIYFINRSVFNPKTFYTFKQAEILNTENDHPSKSYYTRFH